MTMKMLVTLTATLLAAVDDEYDYKGDYYEVWES